MRTINIDNKKVGKVLKNVCSWVVFGLAMTLPYVTEKNVKSVKRQICKATYSDAMGAIMDSTMYSSDKQKVVEMLKENGTAEYYNAIIKVVESTMFGSDIVKTVGLINDKSEIKTQEEDLSN